LKCVGLDFVELVLEGGERGFVGFGELVEEGVGEAIGAAYDDALAGIAFVGDLERAQRLAVEGDEVVFTDEQIDLGGLQLFFADAHGVHDDEQVVLEVLNLGDGRVGDAVLDREGVELEGVFEDEFDLFVGGFGEVDPEEDARLGAQRGKAGGGRVGRGELVVAIDEGRDHGRGLRATSFVCTSAR